MSNVRVTYQEMESAAQRLETGRQDITGALQQLQSLVNDLVRGGYVTDSSSAAFEQSYEAFTKGATQAVDGLTGMTQYLNKAAETFRQADEQLAQALRG